MNADEILQTGQPLEGSGIDGHQKDSQGPTNGDCGTSICFCHCMSESNERIRTHFFQDIGRKRHRTSSPASDARIQIPVVVLILSLYITSNHVCSGFKASHVGIQLRPKVIGRRLIHPNDSFSALMPPPPGDRCYLAPNPLELAPTDTHSIIFHPVLVSSMESSTPVWSNPASDRLKSMVAATLWGVPLLLVLLVVGIAVLFSAVMPVIDKMFYETLEQELQLYLPTVWTQYQENLNGETLSSRRDLQMELWDQLAEYKAERLREIYTSRRCAANDNQYYQEVWDRIGSQLEEGEELENRPDLIAQLEEGLLKRNGDGTGKRDESSDVTTVSSKNGLQSIVGNELNRVDLMMRLFDKQTEYTGSSRQQIYRDWEKQRLKTGEEK